jgi:hypothetical protein
VDGDGDLDLAAAHYGGPNRLMENAAGPMDPAADWASVQSDQTRAMAWGDWDNDGDLDMVAGNGRIETIRSRVYESLGDGLDPDAVWSSDKFRIRYVAWGDWDGDGDLDLAAAERYYADVFENLGGTLTAAPVWRINKDEVWAVAWGDVDGDGDLDLAVGGNNEQRLYENDGSGLGTTPVWTSVEQGRIRDLSWGDMDNDGDLDLAVVYGHNGGPNWIFENVGGTLSSAAVWQSVEEYTSHGVEWGDIDGDGDLDLVVANADGPLQLYENVGGTISPAAVWTSTEIDTSWELDLGDYDGDGDLDVAVANHPAAGQQNRIYRNEGGVLEPVAAWSSAEADLTEAILWADWDGDGDLDLGVGNGWPDGQPNRVYESALVPEPLLPNNPAYADLYAPVPTGEAGFQYSPVILGGPHVTLTYRLFDPEGDPVQRVGVQYSPVGGGYWLDATVVGGDGLTDLAASPEGTLHSLVWDVTADAVWSDRVVIRLVVVQSNPGWAGLIRYPRLASTSAPFRVHAGP